MYIHKHGIKKCIKQQVNKVQGKKGKGLGSP